MIAIYNLKKNRNLGYVILCLLFCCSMEEGFSQQRFVPLPERFERPLYHERQADNLRFLRNMRGDSPRDNQNPFWVLADRNGVRAYDNPDGNRPVANLSFKTPYIVVSEREDWVELYTFTGHIDENRRRINPNERRVGWVRKTDLLLWQTALRDANTNIFKKVFLINRDEYYTEHGFNEERDRVPVLAGPGREAIDNIRVFDFYFVYKIEEFMGVRYYLIGSEYQFTSSPQSFNRIFKGWVEADRLTPWDSRIAFEPNFLIEAINERRANPNKRGLRAFFRQTEVEAYITGSPPENAIWENDPALRSTDAGVDRSLIYTTVGDEGRYRWPGGVLRIPLLGSPQFTPRYPNAIFFWSGLAGDIRPISLTEDLTSFDPNTYSVMERHARNIDVGSRNFNIVFLIEAIDDLTAIQSQFSNLVRGIEDSFDSNEAQNVRIGVVLYKDIHEANPVVAIEPETDFSRVISEVNNTSFRAVEDLDLDDGTSLYQAMDRGFQMFRESESNFFVIIGKNGDKELARGESNNNPGIEELIDKSATYLPSYLVLSLEDENTEFGLTENLQMFIEQGAIDFHQWWQEQLRKAPRMQFPPVPDPQFSDYLRDNNGLHNSSFNSFYFAELVKGFSGSSLRGDLMKNNIQSFMDRAAENRRLTAQTVRELIIDGQGVDDISSGGFTSHGLTSIRSLFQDDAELINSVSHERIKLFLGGYVPYKIDGAEYPLLSTVLFMPAPELDDYINDLERLTEELQDIMRSPEQKAVALSRAFCDLYFRVLGEERRGRDRCEDVSISALRQRVHGIQDSEDANRIDDFRLGRSWGVPDRLSIADIRGLRESVLDNVYNQLDKTIENLRYLRSGDEFSFESSPDESGRTLKYYWIPLVDAF